MKSSSWVESEIHAGALGGALVSTPHMHQGPVVLILPGSGPTDRDGNSPLGIKAATYRRLAWALAARGVASVRVDKRGLYSSAGAVPDPNAVTLADYAGDAETWCHRIRDVTGSRDIWLLGHSEGGLVALLAALAGSEIAGLILVASPGRAAGHVLRTQLRANPANAPLLEPAMAAIDALEAGRTIDDAILPAPLQALFRAEIQLYLIDLFSHDPADLLSRVSQPVLILQGTKDIQIGLGDAERLAAARRGIDLRLMPNVNHVLKTVTGDDLAANIAAYGDPDLPLAADVADGVTDFVAKYRK